MSTIYILTVDTEDDNFIMLFSTQEKAINFIKNNFESDKPRKITDGYFEGKNNAYVINEHTLDQEKFL